MSFFSAIETTTVEIIQSLREKPFSALCVLADSYRKVSSYEFGALTCEWDGMPAFAGRPLQDLAMLVCFPEQERPANPWPPSGMLWDSRLRVELLELSLVMKAWAQNFLDLGRVPHWRMIEAGLETMRTWLQDPTTQANDRWWGISEIFCQRLPQPSDGSIRLQGWDPGFETEEQFTVRVKEIVTVVEKWANNQISQIKPLLVKIDTKRNPDHFNWAALRLARELTYPQIAELWTNAKPQDTTGLDEGTVRKGVQTTLMSLGLRDLSVKRK